MKVNGINPNKVISLYSEHKKNIEKKDQVQKNDTVQISSLGKSLSSYSLDDKFVNSKEKIERLTNEVKNGTYNIDSRLVAEKMIEEMKM
ncbi:flagellar biosynthesis anti-sigma factor FlgM [Clostridium carboxidivorans P7]|uniref:Negative regulator of flagellin synthesis n=1 Tax=Clostridium carboxidivorans P7 TaxID=536227 RepID=C6PPJ9_9CLOT|nr:flagellar biosynthesis anti-sigma factor FlgM [Clostridium carboxidivorans]AKN33908.1 flagellar biosynthesis anti-sigma factor FlgM [Clostridium carboxidivorans P7]EET88893.1 anti-sigma-28 factor, FlgM [Clostridium carboxidivorans P7]EFG88222.1 flagellar biosynthesis anti-sigma factor FlgM [Clostridium carboxidivorans P7]